MSSIVVPWPGRRGSSTWNPSAANASARVRNGRRVAGEAMHDGRADDSGPPRRATTPPLPEALPRSRSQASGHLLQLDTTHSGSEQHEPQAPTPGLSPHDDITTT